MATTLGTLKETGKKHYLHGPFYINGEEYWEIHGCSKKFKREEFEDGLPTIPREDFLQELQQLFIKYNASIDVSYEETCVLGDPMKTSVYIDDYKILEVEGGGLYVSDLNID